LIDAGNLIKNNDKNISNGRVEVGKYFPLKN